MGEYGLSRRQLLASGAAATAGLAFGPAFLRDALASATAGTSPYGPLGAPDALGLRLPAGFSSRLIARGNSLVPGTLYPWHVFSDGAAVFATGDGGWILASNSESLAFTGAGASSIRFAPDGSIRSAYRILAGTNINCAGGPTPWGTWLSGEEHDAGMMWEADPAGVLPARPRPGMGNFAHEAAAVDPVEQRVYLTEDESDGGFYRFTPDSYPDLSAGLLEIAQVVNGVVTWHEVPDPNIVTGFATTRDQVPQKTSFDGGEGIWYHRGVMYFTTKGDKRVWSYTIASRAIQVIYDHSQSGGASLNAVDNVTVNAADEIYVCEDGGNMEIGIISAGQVAPFVEVTGPEHAGSEMAGVVFDPSQQRLYFASQRAFRKSEIDNHDVPGGNALPFPADGAVYEVTGPFNVPAGGIPADEVYGPPAGERPNGPLHPFWTGASALRLRTAPSVRRTAALAGIPVQVQGAGTGTVRVVLRATDFSEGDLDANGIRRPRMVTLAQGERRGNGEVVLRPVAGAAALTDARTTRLVVQVVAATSRGRQASAATVITLT